MNKRPIVLIAAAGLLAAPNAYASPFGTFDPRSLAMGGVGVTMATARNANFFNPAMLAATRDDQDFALGLPILAASARTSNADLVEDVDDLLDIADTLSAQLASFRNDVPDANGAAQAASAVRNFDTALARVDTGAIDIDAFAGSIVAVPSKSIGVGVHFGARANLGAKFTYADADAALLTGLANDLDLCAQDTVGNAAQCASAQAAIDTAGGVNGLQSTMQVRGLLVRELGVALAQRFASLNEFDAGITTKIQRIRTFDYLVTADDSDIRLDQGQRDENSVNFDVGVAKNYGDSYKAGIVVKNLLKKDFTTVNGNVIQVQPQVRMGVSHHRGWLNVGADLDLTKNKPVASGFDQETQFLALGAEFDAFDTLQFRLGYRHDLTGNYDGVPSIGLGFSPLGMHIDLAVAYTDKEVAGGAQLGFSF